MLEILSKNGSLVFHQYLAEEAFMKEFMKTFKLCRGKAGFFSRFETKSKRDMREKTEHHALYLLQLWADTFMMHQETYPGFQKYYRELKVGGVKFPERDRNERSMMDNLEGISSPMFDFIEQQMDKRKNPKPVLSSPPITENHKEDHENSAEDEKLTFVEKAVKSNKSTPEKTSDPSSKVKDKHNYLTLNDSVIDEVENSDYNQYKVDLVDKMEFEEAKANVNILDNMLINCSNHDDMCKDVVINLYITAMKSKLRIEKILEIRKLHQVKDDFESELLEMVRYVNGKIDDFKTRFEKLKRRHERKIRKEEIAKLKQHKNWLEKNQPKSEDNNPFAVLDQTETLYDVTQNLKPVLHGEESSSDDDKDGQSSGSDSDDLHEGPKLKKPENKRNSKPTTVLSKGSDAGAKEQPGFFRNSVLVQKTLNFFGRKSKINSMKHEVVQQNTDNDSSNSNLDEKVMLPKMNSDIKPEISDFFKQTADDQKENDNIFENAKEEVDIDYFKQNLGEKSPIDEADQEAEEDNTPSSKPIFKYNENSKPNIPRPKVGRNSDNIKKLVQPPSNKSGFRNSEVQKFDYNKLFDHKA